MNLELATFATWLVPILLGIIAWIIGYFLHSLLSRLRDIQIDLKDLRDVMQDGYVSKEFCNLKHQYKN